MNPQTGESFVLLRIGEYDRLKRDDDDDDTPWTREELHILAWNAGNHLGWGDDMDEYDDTPEPA